MYGVRLFDSVVENDVAEIVLVTPVWNDSARLEVFGFQLAKALLDSDLPVRWIVADDGSDDREQLLVDALVERLAETYSSVESMCFEKRSRKGGAIYAAWEACPSANWLAFVDADGAIDADTTVRLLQRTQSLETNTAVIGVRRNSDTAPVHRMWMRSISFQLFRGLVRHLTGIRFQDTQCGAKLVCGDSYRAVFANLKERGFVFDVELLLALRENGTCIEEMSIPWSEQPEGKVNPLRDAWGMIAALLRIRRRMKAKDY